MATARLTCRRDKTPTTLKCSRCETPICPRCSVVTDVGQRCFACAGGKPHRRISLRWWPVPVAIAGIAFLVVVVLAAGNEGSPAPASVSGRGQQVTGFRTILRPDLGYTVNVPAGWLPAADDSATTTSYADNNTVLGSLRFDRRHRRQPAG
jgi:hypothetical protein